MGVDDRFERYQDLQRYVGWTAEDAERVAGLAALLEPFLAPIVDDFYQEIDGHAATRKIITGGPAQIARLKGTLLDWLRELLAGRYDEAYVARRWQVGTRHVEIGLDQVFTNAALSRIRQGLLRALQETWTGSVDALHATTRALNALLDLDLAIIEDAYNAEYTLRQQRIERLATIGQVAGGVAHELRNPLNVVKTSVYYLLNARGATAEKKAEHLERIERHVGLADDVITTLSNFARMPVPTAGAFDLETCLREALELNPLSAEIEVALALPADLPPVSADARQIGIVFANLIRNARDAMPDGGALAIAARVAGDVVEVSVSDSGVGISASDLTRIMEPLFTTKPRGLGLGLAIARAILDKNRGAMSVASAPGRGSVFTVRLPLSRPDGGDEGPGAATEWTS